MEKISIFYFIRWIGKRIGDNADVFLRNGIFSEILGVGKFSFAQQHFMSVFQTFLCCYRKNISQRKFPKISI